MLGFWKHSQALMNNPLILPLCKYLPIQIIHNQYYVENRYNLAIITTEKMKEEINPNQTAFQWNKKTD